MKHLPHVLGVLSLSLTMLWVADSVNEFAVAQRISDTRYMITATGWETVYAVWPVVAAAAVISGGIMFFSGLVLGENWVTRYIRREVMEIMGEVEAERIMIKSKSDSLLRRQKEVEGEIRAEKYQVRRCLQKIREREKALEEREKNLAKREKELAVTKAINDRIYQELTSMLKKES